MEDVGLGMEGLAPRLEHAQVEPAPARDHRGFGLQVEQPFQPARLGALEVVAGQQAQFPASGQQVDQVRPDQVNTPVEHERHRDADAARARKARLEVRSQRIVIAVDQRLRMRPRGTRVPVVSVARPTHSAHLGLCTRAACGSRRTSRRPSSLTHMVLHATATSRQGELRGARARWAQRGP